MTPEDVIALLKKAKVAEALQAAGQADDRQRMAELLTEFAGALDYVRDKPSVCEAILKRSLMLDPKNPLTHYNLGVVFSGEDALEADEKNAGRAEKAFRRALELKPDFLEARYNLALLLYFLGRKKEAWEERERIFAAVGDDMRFRELSMMFEADRRCGEE
jgi:tetratricopeptide (TPR) repeat protein